ncbi:MAG TPA: NfeD family protein [Alphaproteobacteria bacterium]
MTTDLVILVLFILGLAFMALEAFVPTFGLLGLAGVGSFIAAIVMLNGHDVFYGIPVNMPLLIGLGIIGVVVLAASFLYTRKTLKKGISAGAEIMPGMSAKVISWTGTSGRVRVDGEEWAASGPEGLVPGDIVIIQSRDNLTLILKKDA